MRILQKEKIIQQCRAFLIAVEILACLAVVSVASARDSNSTVDRLAQLAKDPLIFGKYHPGFCLPYAVAFSLRAHLAGATKVVGIIYDWMDPNRAQSWQTHMIVAIPIADGLWFWADNQHPGHIVHSSSFYDLALQASRASAPDHLVWVRAALDLSSGSNQLASKLLEMLRQTNGDFRNQTAAFEEQTGLKVPLDPIARNVSRGEKLNPHNVAFIQKM